MINARIFVVDGNITIHCPACGTVKEVSVAKFKDLKHSLTVCCVCKNKFQIHLDFRRKYRKSTALPAHFENFSNLEVKKSVVLKSPYPNCKIVNISLSGIGLYIYRNHYIEKGNELRVKFKLDDKHNSSIDRTVMVIIVDKDYVGCEFNDTDPYCYNKTLGFYLMPEKNNVSNKSKYSA